MTTDKKAQFETLDLHSLRAHQIALLRAFPTKQAFIEFKEQDSSVSRKSIPKFIAYAKQLGLIQAATEAAFMEFIEARQDPEKAYPVAENLTFVKIIDDIRGKHSVSRIIDQLNAIAVQFDLPKIQPSLVSRMRTEFNPNTPKKRTFLRLLAYWSGLTNTELNWDYQAFLALSSSLPSKIQVEENTEGVRIDISFQQKGEIIDFEMIEWIKNEIEDCIRDLKLLHLFGHEVKFYSTTVASLEIPKKPGPSREPRLYTEAIRDSLSIAHQLTVRWALAEDVNQGRNNIIIAIGAGEFSKLASILQTVIEAEIPDVPSIRLTEFAKICTWTTDTKIILNETPFHCPFTSGKTLFIWTVKCFWFQFYDYIPHLLKEDMLPTTTGTFNNFKESIYFPDTADSSGKIHNALQALRKYPHNVLLALEIAKVCFGRRMFIEANHILNMVLATDPYHLVARSMRLVLNLNLAMGQTEYQMFDLFFQKSLEETKFIQRYCKPDENAWVEIGQLYFSRALFILSMLRRKAPIHAGEERMVRHQQVIADIRRALKYHLKGHTFSPSGNRANYWFFHLTCLLELFTHNPQYATDREPILDSQGTYAHLSPRYAIFLGMLDPDFLQVTDMELIETQMRDWERRILSLISAYTDSVQCRSYRPNLNYAMASLNWDFAPLITVGVAKRVLSLLESARREAESLFRDRLGVYSIVSWNTMIQKPERFIACVSKSIETVRNLVQDDLGKEEDHVINPNKIGGLKLITMHLDQEISIDPLLEETPVI